MLKYHNKKTVCHGITFASKKEAERYIYLSRLQATKQIVNLELQPKYLICEGFRHDGKKERDRYYIADFRYIKNGILIVEDVKSPFTKKLPLYRLKRHIFLQKYGQTLTFLET